jgi:hypothetical protein
MLPTLPTLLALLDLAHLAHLLVPVRRSARNVGTDVVIADHHMW